MSKKQKFTLKAQNSSKVAYCPSCDNPVHIKGSIRLSQKFLCKSCKSELEVIELNPLTLDWAFDYEDTVDNPYSNYGDPYYYDDYSVDQY